MLFHFPFAGLLVLPLPVLAENWSILRRRRHFRKGGREGKGTLFVEGRGRRRGLAQCSRERGSALLKRGKEGGREGTWHTSQGKDGERERVRGVPRRATDPRCLRKLRVQSDASRERRRDFACALLKVKTSIPLGIVFSLSLSTPAAAGLLFF